MTLNQLQQQIVSEAVKAFRERFVEPYREIVGTDSPQAKTLTESHEHDMKLVESFLTDQLTQATQRALDGGENKVAEEARSILKEAMRKENGKWIVEVSDALADSWLNHNSEEGK